MQRPASTTFELEPVVVELRPVALDDGPAVTETNHVFRNPFDEPVRIDRAVVSCGCVATTIDHRLIEPGETAEVHLAYEVARPGPSRQIADLVLSNGAVQRIELRAVGTRRSTLQAFITSIDHDAGVIDARVSLTGGDARHHQAGVVIDALVGTETGAFAEGDAGIATELLRWTTFEVPDGMPLRSYGRLRIIERGSSGAERVAIRIRSEALDQEVVLELPDRPRR